MVERLQTEVWDVLEDVIKELSLIHISKGETSHTEARNDYAADREAEADLVQQMYDATEGDGQKQIMQKIYDGVNNVLERMDLSLIHI